MEMEASHGLVLLNGLQQFPALARFICFPYRHGASTIDYIMAQPSFIPYIHDFIVVPLHGSEGRLFEEYTDL